VRLLDEKRSLELRCELFNAFNHTQFSALDTTARFERDGTQINPLFLQPTAARRPAPHSAWAAPEFLTLAPEF
jgi:hypothetical protein